MNNNQTHFAERAELVLEPRVVSRFAECCDAVESAARGYAARPVECFLQRREAFRRGLVEKLRGVLQSVRKSTGKTLRELNRNESPLMVFKLTPQLTQTMFAGITHQLLAPNGIRNPYNCP